MHSVGAMGEGVSYSTQQDVGNSISLVLQTVNKATEEYKGPVAVAHDVSLHGDPFSSLCIKLYCPAGAI